MHKGIASPQKALLEQASNGLNMHPLSRSELRQLAATTADPCVSLYLPGHSPGLPLQNRWFQFDRLLHEGGVHLQRSKLSRQAIWNLLKLAETVLENEQFWYPSPEGIALYLTLDSLYSCRVPLELEPLIVVGDRFYLKPLMPLLSANHYGYLLTLSDEQIRLYQVTQTAISPLPWGANLYSLKEPSALAQKTCGDRRSRTLPTVRGRTSLVTVEKQEAIRQVCAQVNTIINTGLSNEEAPVFLIAEKEFQSIYRYVNTCPRLLNFGLEQNPHTLSLETLHQAAWEGIEPCLKRSQQQNIQQFKALQSIRQASACIEHIIPAAYQGQINTLFVLEGQQHWGQTDPIHGTLEHINDTHPQDGKTVVDLLDLATIYTFLAGGKVYLLPAEKMPTSAPMAAIYQNWFEKSG